jgi:hypothetical protein
MYSGKIAVPPGGGGIVKRVVLYSIKKWVTPSIIICNRSLTKINKKLVFAAQLYKCIRECIYVFSVFADVLYFIYKNLTEENFRHAM